MKKIVMLAALAGSASVAMADVLLQVDLSVPNVVTITSTTGVSAVDTTGPTGVGIYLAGFFSANGAFLNLGGTGNFRSVSGSVGDGTPSLYRDTASDPGLNVWSFATTATFVIGQQAFSGTGTWNLTPAQFAAFSTVNTSGNIYFQADDVSDIPNARILGTWEIIPTPSAAAVFGLGALAAGRRRRA